MFALKGQLLMSAAEIAGRVADADAALGRLKAAASAMDAAARADKSGDAEIALNGAAIYAMVAALEAVGETARRREKREQKVAGASGLWTHRK